MWQRCGARCRIEQSSIMDRKLKHLEFIQGTVNRLSTNSFLLKGWSVVLVSALFVLSGNQANHKFTWLAFIPAIVFWGLDGYFLWQERLYRKLYDRVREKTADDIDFAMDTREFLNDVGGWLKAVFSKTLIPFHGVLVVAIIVVMNVL
jgi:hypothetical protein